MNLKQSLHKKDYKPLIKRALAEDLGKNGDITSRSIFSNTEKAIFTLIAKDDGILCGAAVFTDVFHTLDRNSQVTWYFSDGDRITKGTIIARVSAKLIKLLSGERIALNLISHLSAIATKSSLFSEAAGSKLIVLDTRKTIPGMRMLQKYAVRTGGSQNHRIGLFDMILIKDNHVDAAGGITLAVEKARKRWGKKFKIEVETRNLKEVQEAIDARVDRIMLDNMNYAQVKEAVDLIAGRAETEASGNLSIEDLPPLSDTGVDFVSFGELTHSNTVFDFSLKRER